MPRGYAWQRGACMVKGVHGKGGCMAKGACVVKAAMHGKGGHAWQKGGMRGEGGVHGMHPTHPTRYGRLLRGRYASYWNAFLSNNSITDNKQRENGTLAMSIFLHSFRMTVNILHAKRILMSISMLKS